MMPPAGAVAFRSTSRLVPILCLASLSSAPCLAAAPQDRYSRPDPYDASVRVLRDAVQPPQPGTRNPGLTALINLNDPDLRPLFQSLVQRQDQPILQSDAIIGIASADAGGTIDPFTLRQVTDASLRSEVIKSLIGRRLIKPAELNQILRWPDAPTAEDRLFLAAALEREGASWSPSELDGITETSPTELRALAALLLLEHGQPGPWETFRTSFAGLPLEDRNELLALLAPAIRSYRLESAVDPLLKLATDRDIDATVRAAVVGSALELDAPTGVAALRQEVALDRSPPNMLRYALLLLVASELEGIDREAFSIFDGSESTEVEALVAAGRCAHGGPECAAAFNRTIDLGLRPAAEWCMERARRLAEQDPELTREVMNRVLDLAMQARDSREPILILAVKAAETLVELDPDSLRRRLEDPATPPPLLDSLALALIEAASDRTHRSSHPESRRTAAANLASAVRSKLPRRFDSMALIAIARSGRPLTPDELEQLGAIASGGGRIDEPLQVQAAWLYLKAAGRYREALARIAPE